MAAQTWVFWVIQFEVGAFPFSVSRLVYFSQTWRKNIDLPFCTVSNTFSFNSRSVFTLHCNTLSWKLIKWPPYDAPLPDSPERNQDFENEKRSRPTIDASLSDLNISYSLYAYAFTNSVFVRLFVCFSREWACVALNQVSTGLQFHLLSSLFLIESHSNRSKNVWVSIKWQRPFTKGKFASQTLVVVKKKW